VCKISAEVKVSEIQGDEKVVSAASLRETPVETPLFDRDRCRSLEIPREFKKQDK
jgi:hypothetical protein